MCQHFVVVLFKVTAMVEAAGVTFIESSLSGRVLHAMLASDRSILTGIQGVKFFCLAIKLMKGRAPLLQT